MRIIIAGSRSFNSPALLKLWADRLTGPTMIEYVLCGMAAGADRLGHNWAVDSGHKVKEFPADWEKYGKAAGMLRNGAMARDAAAATSGMLLAFWDGESRGTRDMIMKAFDCKLEVHVIRFRAEGDGVVVKRTP